MMDAAQPAIDPTQPAPDSGSSAEASAAAEAAHDGIVHGAQVLWRELSQLASDHLELALLETQRAGKSAVNMLIYAIGAALLLITAWLGLLAAAVVGLAAWGLHPAWAILTVVAVNLAGAFGLYLLIRQNSANLRFPATVRSLKSDLALIRTVGRP